MRRRDLVRLAGWVLMGLSLGQELLAADSSSLHDRLLQAAASSAIDDASLKPWHLKLVTDGATPKEAGTATVEEWWAGPERYRIEIKSAKFTGTEIRNADGLFRSGDVGQAPEAIERMRLQVVHPMPTVEEIGRAKLYERSETLGKTPEDCVMVGEEIRDVQRPTLGLFPTYCLDKGTDLLRLTVDYGTLQTLRSQFGTFQGRHVAVKIRTFEAGVPGVGSHVEILESTVEAQMDLKSPPGARKVGDTPETIAAGVMSGRLLFSVRPLYPDGAKQRHVSGTVVLSAVIGRDGRVSSLHLVSYRDGELALAALAAVRQWRYEPYLLNGEPTEVVTTVTVNFHLG